MSFGSCLVFGQNVQTTMLLGGAAWPTGRPLPTLDAGVAWSWHARCGRWPLAQGVRVE